ncbi:serine/threonine-protein kinase pim-3-like [Megalobrama amblycephala]|uniref:serine/threonine-protein kinase pim-3-like n=1 Tax=Megalobrama amblycephala TaxID=75352 RepID=UPI00201455BB|nr:serine/threonine-protein kinase pim-3-like [Megalobrama amblycephala]
MANSIETQQGLAQRKRRQEEAHPSTSHDSPAKRSRKGYPKKAYKKGHLLGEGSFRSVYAGTRRFDRLPVAIKYATKDEDTMELKVDGQGLVPLEVALMKRVNAALACPNIIQLVKWFDCPTQDIMKLEQQDPCQDLSTFCAENVTS